MNKPLKATRQERRALELQIFRRLFDYLCTAEPSVPFRPSCVSLELTATWAENVEAGVEHTNIWSLWGEYHDEIAWNDLANPELPRLGVGLLGVLGYFGEVLPLWGHVKLPPYVALLAFFEIQPEKLIDIRWTKRQRMILSVTDLGRERLGLKVCFQLTGRSFLYEGLGELFLRYFEMRADRS